MKFGKFRVLIISLCYMLLFGVLGVVRWTVSNADRLVGDVHAITYCTSWQQCSQCDNRGRICNSNPWDLGSGDPGTCYVGAPYCCYCYPYACRSCATEGCWCSKTNSGYRAGDHGCAERLSDTGFCPAGCTCGKYRSTTQACENHCIKVEWCESPIVPVCGNGIIEEGEACDPPGASGQCSYGICQEGCTCPDVPENHAPQVISITPEPTSTCTTSWTGKSDNNPIEFEVKYRDVDGFEDIETVGFEVDDARFQFSVEDIAGCSSELLKGITLLSCSAVNDGVNDLNVSWKIRFNSKEKINMPLNGYVSDGEAADGWVQRNTWSSDLTAPVSGVAIILNRPNIDIDFSASDSGGSKINYSQKLCLSDPAGKCSDWTSWTDDSTPHNQTANSWSNTLAVETGSEYTIKLKTIDNACNWGGEASAGARLTGPWLMTAYGDTYASGGYSSELKMQKVTAYDIPKGGDDEASFATYIVSSGNSDIIADKASLRGYLLKTYHDDNIEKLEVSRVYDDFQEILVANSKSFELVETSTLPGSCSGKHVYHSSSGLTFDNNFTSGATDACVFVVDGDVTIAADVDRIDGFFFADRFITKSDHPEQSLVIYGGVIARKVNFGRDLGEDGNQINPSEIIIYDPKYLDLLKEYLGRLLSFKVREYKYGRP